MALWTAGSSQVADVAPMKSAEFNLPAIFAASPYFDKIMLKNLPLFHWAQAAPARYRDRSL
jgi:hypothetical protein